MFFKILYCGSKGVLTLASDAFGVELNTPLQTVQLRRGFKS